MVTEAAAANRDRYVMIGMPVDSNEGTIRDFVEGRGVGGFPHLMESWGLWSQLGVNATPTWATITADGQVNRGAGTMPASVRNGDWIS
ncbi:MAG: hypothetical protein AAF547_20225 [Actinomycetota bacterium]